VVMVAVVTLERVATASGVRGIEQATPVGLDRHLAGCGHRVKCDAPGAA
jgi:hypothetical protein